MDRREFVASAGALAALAPFHASAQDAWPARPVKMIVPFPPGGATDVMGRTAAKGLSERLGQAFVVENRAGAGGNVGTDAIAKASPDGYTIGVGPISSLAISPHLYPKLPFSVERDFTPITLIGTTPCLIVVHPSVPFDDLKGLVAYARANPGKLQYATSGIGTSNHLATELLQVTAGIKLSVVAYKGSSQIVADLLAGTVPMSMETSLSTTLQHIKAGKLKPIAITSPKRARQLPDVPTIAESGYPGFAVETWFGLVGPAGMPRPIVDKIHAAWRDSAGTPATHAAYEGISGDIRVSTPQEFGAFMAADHARWGELIRKLGIKAD